MSALRQLCNYIPTHLVPELSRSTGAQEKARTYSAWSHVLALLYAQLTHALGLNGLVLLLALVAIWRLLAGGRAADLFRDVRSVLAWRA